MVTMTASGYVVDNGKDRNGNPVPAVDLQRYQRKDGQGEFVKAKLTLSVPNGKAADGKNKYIYIPVQVTGKQAESVCQYCVPNGTVNKLLIEGDYAQDDQYQDKTTGEMRTPRPYLNARRVEFIGNKTDVAGGQGTAPVGQPMGQPMGQAPQAPAYGQTGPVGQPTAPQAPAYGQGQPSGQPQAPVQGGGQVQGQTGFQPITTPDPDLPF